MNLANHLPRTRCKAGLNTEFFFSYTGCLTIAKEPNLRLTGWRKDRFMLFPRELAQISCLNFWDDACWFLSLRVFGLLSSSLLLFPQRFGRYVLWPSGVCRTREPSRNFEQRPLLNPRGSPVLILLAITGYKC